MPRTDMSRARAIAGEIAADERAAKARDAACERMARKGREIRPATPEGRLALAYALKSLRDARDWLRKADCPKAMEAVQAAIKSTEGAERHMAHRLARTTGEG